MISDDISTYISYKAEKQSELNEKYLAAALPLTEAFIANICSYTTTFVGNELLKVMPVDLVINQLNIRTQTAIEQARHNAVSLIKSIPTECLGKVDMAIEDYMNGELKIPLTERLKEIADITDNRAKLIARDQASKMVSAVSEARYLDAGITEYIWYTVRDVRVVGTPASEGGLYPNPTPQHWNHYKRHNKKFSFLSPPNDGNPGFPINCRCVAIPIVNMEKGEKIPPIS